MYIEAVVNKFLECLTAQEIQENFISLAEKTAIYIQVYSTFSHL